MKIAKAFLIFVLFGLLGYLLLPSSSFPKPPPDAVQSLEDADIETPLRRAYFTNYNRQEVLAHYQKQFRGYRLNYPPEDAQVLIRDQARSSYLEEILHPFRESVFINGFIPKEAKDDIWYKGRHFEQKITVRYAPSSLLVRIPVILLSLSLFAILIKEWRASFLQ